MLDNETKVWLAGIFSKEELKAEDIHQRCHEILEAHAGELSPELFYELAQANSDAAFYLLQLFIEKKFSLMTPVSTLFPLIYGSDIYADANVVKVEKPQAFRLFPWGTIKSASIDPAKREDTLETQTIFQAALIAGIMKKSYDLAYAFSFERMQGGRLIKDWSLIQQLLAELYLQTKTHELFIPHLTFESALSIFKHCDLFESQCMQIMGGAGYTEDYLLEKYFREIHFLKNWPEPFGQKLISFYKNKVLAL